MEKVKSFTRDRYMHAASAAVLREGGYRYLMTVSVSVGSEEYTRILDSFRPVPVESFYGYTTPSDFPIKLYLVGFIDDTVAGYMTYDIFTKADFNAFPEWLAEAARMAIPNTEKIKRGEWIVKDDPDEDPFFRRKYYCSACGKWNTWGKTARCSRCGAIMKVEDENNG